MLAADDFLTLSAAILGRGQNLRFKAHGGSMFPIIRSGAILEVKPLGKTPVRVGEVVFYRNPGGRMVAHRLIRKNFQNSRPIFLARGDALSCQVEEICPSQILGRVVRVEQEGRCRNLDRLRERLLGKILAYLVPALPYLARISNLLGDKFRFRLKAGLSSALSRNL